MRPWRAAVVGFVALALAGCSIFGKGKQDADGTTEEARPLELERWKADEFACRGGKKGDCNDWSEIDLGGPGKLAIEVEILEDPDPVPPFAISLVDSEGLTVQETNSGGRSRAGLRSEADPGQYRIWLRPSDPDHGRFRYQIRASFDGPAGDGGDLGRPVCIDLRASPRLNFYEGQPHVVVLTLFPLSSALGFEGMHVRDLLLGEAPPALIGSKLELTIAPGEARTVKEVFPPGVRQVGLVADYFRVPGAPEGQQRLVVKAACGAGTPRVVLGEADMVKP